MNKIIVVVVASLLIISISITYEIYRRRNLDSQRRAEFEELPYRALDRLLSFVIENEQPLIKDGIKRPRRRFAVGFGIGLDVLVERGRLKHCVTQNGTIPIPPELSIYFDDHSHSRPTDVLAAELEDEEETSHHEMDIDAGVDVDEELTKQKYELFVSVSNFYFKIKFL